MQGRGVLAAFAAHCMVSLSISSALAAKCDKTFADVFEAVSPSVVMITAITVTLTVFQIGSHRSSGPVSSLIPVT